MACCPGSQTHPAAFMMMTTAESHPERAAMLGTLGGTLLGRESSVAVR
jgi:hypothetical protein